jgi:L-asparaginase II
MTDMTDYVELARVWRGPVVESRHRGAVMVADYDGKLRGSWGDGGLFTFPRSALKPFQAIALIESGAADAYGLTDEHIALAAASHHAEPFQVALVEDWLGRLGLNEAALVCGPALPQRQQDQGAAFAAGGPRRAFHNCSGKHCGFLSVARHMGGDLNYADPSHPAQKLFLDIFSEFLGYDAASLPRGLDGCGLPTYALPMRDAATAMARFGQGWAKAPARRAAAKRVARAMMTHPDHLSGTDSATARLLRGAQGKVILKGGAEGYVLAAAPERGLGIAIKVADGGTRAKFGTLARTLGHFGILRTAEAEALINAVEPPPTNSNGDITGRIEVVFETPVPTTPTLAGLEFWMGGVMEALYPKP